MRREALFPRPASVTPRGSDRGTAGQEVMSRGARRGERAGSPSAGRGRAAWRLRRLRTPSGPRGCLPSAARVWLSSANPLPFSFSVFCVSCRPTCCCCENAHHWPVRSVVRPPPARAPHRGVAGWMPGQGQGHLPGLQDACGRQPMRCVSTWMFLSLPPPPPPFHSLRINGSSIFG